MSVVYSIFEYRKHLQQHSHTFSGARLVLTWAMLNNNLGGRGVGFNLQCCIQSTSLHPGTHKSQFGRNKFKRVLPFGHTPKKEIDMQIINSANFSDKIQ